MGRFSSLSITQKLVSAFVGFGALVVGFGGVALAQLLALGNTGIVALLVAAGAAAAAGCLSVFLLFRTVVSKRLARLVEITGALTSGRTDVVIPAQQSQDELTVMFDAFGRFRDALIQQTALEESERQRGVEDGQRRRASDRLTDDLRATLQAVMQGRLSERVDSD